MKKGDIVKIKWATSNLYRALVGGLIPGEEGKIDNAPKELTVNTTGSIEMCCTYTDYVIFDELPGVKFSQNHFEVLLEAGEPDVSELVKESDQRQLVWGILY
jgi:hypothetical protein